MTSDLASLLLVPLVLIVTAWKLYKSKSKGTLTLFFLIFYSIFAICSIGFYYIYNELVGFYAYEHISSLAFVYWLILFFIILLPVYRFENSHLQAITYNIKIVHLIAIFGLVISIIPFLELLPEIGSMFGGSSGDISDNISEMHDDSDEKEEKLSVLGHYLMRGVWVLYDLSFLLIYPLLKEKKKNYVAILGVVLLIFTRNMLNFAYVSRTGLFVLILHIIVIFIILYPFFVEKEKKVMKRIVSVIFFSVLFAFVVITLARSTKYSEKQQDYTLAAFVARYTGEGFCNFGGYAFKAKEPLGGVQTLYVPRKMLGIETPLVTREYLYGKAAQKQGVPQNVFYTFIGTFVLDLGPFWGAVLLCFIGWPALLVFGKKRRLIPLSYLYLFSVYVKILEFGPISYVYSSKESEYIVMYFFIFILLRILKM